MAANPENGRLLANSIRHGTDAGQPGGSPAYTIAVTEDMCAEIAACSGRQTKRGPVYIWHADIDEGARIAADIATDFIPGVTQAKTAYDAYTRIQNGEDPVEVLVAAGGDAALGLIPGLKVAKKVDKALDKAEKVADVADAAGDVQRAVRGTQGGPRAGKRFTPDGKREIDAGNAEKHGGVNKCERCGVEVAPGQRSTRGVSPPSNERQRDHIHPRSRNGDGDPSNGQILCRRCNLEKGDELP